KEVAGGRGRHLDGEPIEARPLGLATVVWRRIRKSRAARAAMIGGSLILLAAIAIAVTGREKSSRLKAEQDKLNAIRERARTSLDAVLKLRRAGANEAMKGFVPGLEAALKEAPEAAPDVAGVENPRGRRAR